MKTKALMMASSLVLGLIGMFILFSPESLLAILGVSMGDPVIVLIQLLGALYLALALMNWAAKDKAIGGIYSRPVSLANFVHFFIGTLVIANYLLSNGVYVPMLIIVAVYANFAFLFYWLVFRHTGIMVDKNAQYS